MLLGITIVFGIIVLFLIPEGLGFSQESPTIKCKELFYNDELCTNKIKIKIPFEFKQINETIYR